MVCIFFSLLLSRYRTTRTGDIRCREVKTDFAERDKCKPVLLRLSLGGNLENHSYVPLLDRMEGAWLWIQMQGGKIGILLNEINANWFYWDFHWMEIWIKPLMSLYWTEWRERGYGLGRSQTQGGKNWILPKENANRFFWDSHWLEIWKNNYVPLWDRMEGAWLWTKMQGDKNWILPKEINANRFYWVIGWKTTYVPLFGTWLGQDQDYLGESPEWLFRCLLLL